MARRRGLVFVLAAVAGFLGRDGLASTPAGMTRFLVALFVTVFLLSLLFSVLQDRFAIPSGGEPEAAGDYPEGQQVSHEAVYSSP